MTEFQLPVESGTAKRTGIVVVTHANAQLAAACVRSVSDEIAVRNRVVVVNDGSALRPRDHATLRRIAHVVVNHSLLGYGENVNRGVSELASEVDAIIIANDDVIFDAGAVAVLSATLREHQEAAVVGPAIRDAAGVAQPSAFAFPSLASEVAQELILPESLSKAVRRRFAWSVTGPPRTVDWVLGAAFIVRRSAFEEIGGFDASYFLYSEETDLCFRLSEVGWRVLSDGHASVTHVGAVSTSGGQRRLMSASRGLYLKRHWTRHRRAALELAWPLVSVWNRFYVAVRIVGDPRTTQEKRELLREHRNARAVILHHDEPTGR